MKLVKPEHAGFSTTRLERISAKMQTYVDEGKLAGTITTVARHGQTVHLETTGWMDREAKRSMELDAIFRIASMTKPITAVAIMTLYEEGHFTLNTPVSEFIPGFKDVKVFVRETKDDVIAEAVHLDDQSAALRHGLHGIQNDVVKHAEHLFLINVNGAAGSDLRFEINLTSFEQRLNLFDKAIDECIYGDI